ncbi:NUDIX domain-containing protein [Actinomycetospora corticicola]|uniref:ADP-ribose pyrophosphatase YjhB (NUDIX family) n=1 Tax=Actinomycetospora corticicola TaxID=663602 RepID=A0A7Y9DT74_9PSEU|nr:NUDIX domain-containing protein [Actinomycetospora corticicola]NYD34984.1 ADP-ribose pyrophosphatase YjhB (NUDIX family) [Actinomycetospora corticicola]
MFSTHAAGGVVVDPRGHVVVVSQRSRTWSLPKGHVEDGESVLGAARREIHEECGLADLDLVQELGSFSRMAVRRGLPEYKTITLFLFRSPTAPLAPLDPANPEARWVPAAEVPDLLSHPADGRFFREQALPLIGGAAR